MSHDLGEYHRLVQQLILGRSRFERYFSHDFISRHLKNCCHVLDHDVTANSGLRAAPRMLHGATALRRVLSESIFGRDVLDSLFSSYPLGLYR